MLQVLRELLVPSFCYYCHHSLETNEPLCLSCADFPPLLSLPLALARDKVLFVFALSTYDDPLKQILNSRHANAYAFWVHMGTLLHRFFKEKFLPGDLLIPLPNDSASQRRCGFRKTLVMTNQLSVLSGTPIADVIRPIKQLSHRPYRSTREWYEFLQDAFEIKTLPTHTRIFLIDVSIVTGATLSVFAREIQKNIKSPLHALVLCQDS